MSLASMPVCDTLTAIWPSPGSMKGTSTMVVASAKSVLPYFSGCTTIFLKEDIAPKLLRATVWQLRTRRPGTLKLPKPKLPKLRRGSPPA